MNARVFAPKPCIVCGKLMHVEDYASPWAFERVRACSSTCGGRLQGISSSGAQWGRMLSHRIKGEMTFEEIAVVANVSRQRIHQLFESAMRKLQHNSKVRRMLGDWV